MNLVNIVGSLNVELTKIEQCHKIHNHEVVVLKYNFGRSDTFYEGKQCRTTNPDQTQVSFCLDEYITYKL